MKYIKVRKIINPITEKYSSLPISSAVFLSFDIFDVKTPYLIREIIGVHIVNPYLLAPCEIHS